ncbi:VOC family protein [Halobacillus rhizosphaerae]|uniref:VOC family protein n=1 Tax=Halobacillus rhizosphaerae TaxID=3064889 RepID=UPI00398BA388
MSFLFESIDHIQLAAPEGAEAEARHFFGNVLGLKEIEKPPALKKNGGVWFSFGSYQIHIGIEEPFVPAKKAHPALLVRNILALQNHLEKQGIEYQPDGKLPGANRMYIHDPFGNRIEILERHE